MVEITNEQINAAWAWVRDEPWGHATREALLIALERLNIHRCEGCGGSGEVGVTTKAEIDSFEARWPGIDLGSYDSSCPSCAEWGSKGWVIKCA